MNVSLNSHMAARADLRAARFCLRRASRRARACMAMGLAVLSFVPQADAVFLFTPLGVTRQITLRVGSADTTVNNVTFDVTAANISPNPVPVTGIPGNGAPATSPAGGVEVRVAARFAHNLGNTIRLTADSSAGLTCVNYGCGSTIIPFSTINWTSYNHDATYPAYDIQNGTFNGTPSQELSPTLTWAGGGSSNGSVTMSNVLVFQYNNATLYPSGQYTGRVFFTATIL